MSWTVEKRLRVRRAVSSAEDMLAVEDVLESVADCIVYN
jgi:hypothetical protein